MLGGIQINEPDDEVWVEAVRDAGMNAVSVTAYIKARRWDGAAIRAKYGPALPSSWTPSGLSTAGGPRRR